jgi:DnaK suppressor protein
MNKADQRRYRRQLTEMRERLRSAISRRAESIVADVSPPGEISSQPTHIADRDAEGLHTDITLAETQASLLDDVESALERLEKGEYGRCESCGEEISAARIDALPYARLCIRCAEARESGEKA